MFYGEKPQMTIRRAIPQDLEAINCLLMQVLAVHHIGRPELFKAGTKKYTDEELLAIIADDTRPIFVAEEAGQVQGYAFCIFQQYVNNNILTDVKTLYIDDLCVEKTCRGKHIGSALYRHVLAFAKEQGCYNVTLNVWACNEEAMRFYQNMGLVPQKIGMEQIL